MASLSLHSLSLSSPLPFPFPHFLPLSSSKPLRLKALTPSHSELAMFDSVANLNNGDDSPFLPCVRSFENDAARLSLSGAVAFRQAVTAAAADGGAAATEHVDGGLSVMVVETVFPGSGDDRSTVSTRLFLPALTVQEKARKLRKSIPKDILSSTNSSNILAMTFRQVVFQQLQNFELAIFIPGSRRKMEDLGNHREVTKSFAFSSSDEKVISGLAEAVCSLALENTQREFSHGEALDGFFRWRAKAKKFASVDSSVTIYSFEDNIVENAKSLVNKFNNVRAKYRAINQKQSISAWPSLLHAKLEKIGGTEFSVWVSEYVPAYGLEIDADRLTDLKFEGWQRTTGNRWEIDLTHSQMVGLANVLDMYFEDAFTLPYKQLSSNTLIRPNKSPKSEGGFSLFGIVRTTLVTATLLVSVGVMVKFCLPYLYNTRRDSGDSHVLPSSEPYFEQVQPLSFEPSKLEAYCSSIVRKMKDCYGFNGDVKFEPSVGAWIGELPFCLKNGYGAESRGQESTANSDVSASSEQELKSSVDVASYQVVLSIDGKTVDFKPTNGVAVKNWSSNPIAKELYGEKTLSPGILEPHLKIDAPDDAIVLELLISLSQGSCFALARQMR